MLKKVKKSIRPYPTGQRNFWMYVENVQAWMQKFWNQMCWVYVGSVQAYMQLLSQLLLLEAYMLDACLHTFCTLALYTCNTCKMNVHMHSTRMPSTCSLVFGRLGTNGFFLYTRQIFIYHKKFRFKNFASGLPLHPIIHPFTKFPGGSEPKIPTNFGFSKKFSLRAPRCEK